MPIVPRQRDVPMRQVPLPAAAAAPALPVPRRATNAAHPQIAVFTATIGPGSDPLREPLVHAPGVSYFCAVDAPRTLAPSRIWQPVAIPLVNRDPVLTARQFKIRLHETVARLAPQCDLYIWLDAAYALQVHPAAFVPAALRGDLAVLVHPHRTSIADEATAIARRIKPPFIDPVVLQPQVAKYLADGYPDQSLSTTGLLVRRNDARTAQFNDHWWAAFAAHPHTRDQMSFDYSAWKSGMVISYLPGDYRANAFAHWYHHR